MTTETDPTLWAYDQTGRAILPDWAGAIIDVEIAGAGFEVDARQGNIVTFELPSRYDARTCYVWSLYEREAAAIEAERRRLVEAGEGARAYRYAFHAAKVAAGEPGTVSR